MLGADVYSRRFRKIELERKRLIHCGLCRYHKGENSKMYDYKCWKRYRLTQYK